MAAWVGGPVKAVEPTPPAAPLPARLLVPQRSAEAALREVLQAYPCADAQVVALGEDRWRLTGVVQEAEDEGSLVAALAQAAPALQFEAALQAVGRPVCAAAAVAGRFRDRDQMAMAAVDGKSIYANGEIVAVDLTLPAVPGYLYVDYYQLDGQVVHILPLADRLPTKTQAGGRLRLGDGSTGLILRVAPPFGLEMLTVFVVSEPLFDQPRPLVEAAEEYLPALESRAAQMAADDDGQVLSDALLITTAADR